MTSGLCSLTSDRMVQLWFPSQTAAVRKTFIHGKRLELVVVGWDIKEDFPEKVTWSLVSTVEQKEFPLVGEAEGIRMS